MSHVFIPLSAAQQQAIINNATASVKRFAKAYADRIGAKHLFTKEEVEDIVGNTLYKVCRSYESYNPEKAKLSTWVNRIAVNCVISAVDYKMKRIPISYAMCAENSEIEFNSERNDIFSGFEADKNLEEKDFEACVRAECAKLSQKNLRFEQWLEEGLTPKEMAAKEGCTADAAAKRIWLIRQTLKKSIGKLAS